MRALEMYAATKGNFNKKNLFLTSQVSHIISLILENHHGRKGKWEMSASHVFYFYKALPSEQVEAG